MSRPSAPFLPYGRQVIEDDDIAAVVAVLKGDFLTTGPTIEAFEAAFAAKTGAAHAVVCSSGTAALHLAALALDLGPGDAVIVPSLTFLATANAARFAGAEVVFADVDAESGLLTPDLLRQALGRAHGLTAKAVFPVHLNGQTVDFPALADVAASHGLTVVDDACHAVGATYGLEGVPVGSGRHSAMTCFSLHPVKTIAMGEGGFVTANDPALARRLTRLRGHGMVRDAAAFEHRDLAFDVSGQPNPWYYEMPEIGFNYRASDINCALGLSQLAKLDRFLARRSALAGLYDRALAPLAPVVRAAPRQPDGQPGWHLYAVAIDFAAAGKSRAQVMTELRAKGIGTQVHYLPVHCQPYYRKRYGDLALPGAMAYYERALSLPLYPSMADEDVAYVAEGLAEVLGR